MNPDRIPVFAIIGHPNEGKSSVVSTLVEDDAVPISAVPGETRYSRAYPITVDDKELIRFVDTPGFQNPTETLAWMQAFPGPPQDLLREFVEAHRWNPDFRDECEIFYPIMDRGGLIHVVDASRPLRRTDRVEMEILRLTGLPRMAILNAKTGEEEFLSEWRAEFRRHFNMTKSFNPMRATFAERLELLEGLRTIDEDWAPALSGVVEAFRADWAGRHRAAARVAVSYLKAALAMHRTGTCRDKSESEALREKLFLTLKDAVAAREHQTFAQIRAIFRHRRLRPLLTAQSILDKDIFAAQTWQVLGLTSGQLAAVGALAGAGVGVLADALAHGLSLGAFAGLGGLLGAGAVLWQGDRLVKTRVAGLRLGGFRVTVGPVVNQQFPFVLLDRFLIHYRHVVNWAHARREEPPLLAEGKQGPTSTWPSETRALVGRFFAAARKGSVQAGLQEAFQEALARELETVSMRELDERVLL
ncbi:MAG: DUF3482 domain-containing protein [Deltaproteobacteria bacterium]|nr:DUF3482 domain-containing protein [Deltaproteobacteria bacterium]